MDNTDSSAALIAKWQLILSKEKSWVIFQNGTCVVLQDPEADVETRAKEILKKWGPVVPGTNLGDFAVSELGPFKGWLVYYSHPGIYNLVLPAELPSDSTESDTPLGQDVVVGCLGREKRRADAKTLQIIHIENNRSSA